LVDVSGSWDTLHGEEVEEMLTENIGEHDIQVREIRELDAGTSFSPDVEVLSLIKKLYRGYYNTDLDAEVFTTEFYYLVGEILKGKKLSELKAKYLKLDELKESA
jgi:hypothetical protein